MIIPGCRSSGFSPWPSVSLSGVAPAGRRKAVISWPSAPIHSRANGFSTKTTSVRKNARVAIETTITHGSNSRSRSHLRKPTALAKAAISHDQNTSEPSCPPHSAVTRR